MFKIGVITDEVSQELEPSIQLAERFQLDGLELRTVKDKGVFDFTPRDIAEVKAKAEEAGLSICGISAPFYKCELTDEKEIAESLRGLETCLRMAQTFHTKMIRGFTFWRRKPFEEVLDTILRRFEEPAAMLKGTGVTLALEADTSVNASNASQLAAVIEGVGSPQIQALWDPGNQLYTPGAEVPYPDGYQRLRPHIAHVHLKDAVLNPKGEAVGCAFGRGLVDYPGQFRALAEDGYDGYVVMETHYRKKGTLSEELLKRPGGAAFSADGYEPTAECLENLRELLTKQDSAGALEWRLV